jgi:hypothetical protein
MNFEQLKQAGFSEQEINEHLSGERKTLKQAGFSDQEIDGYHGISLSEENSSFGSFEWTPGDEFTFEYAKTRPDASPGSIKSDIATAANGFVTPFLRQGYTAAAAFNRGMSTFSAHLDAIADFVAGKTGSDKGGLFRAAADTYEQNRAYWQKKADELGIGFIDELIGEAVGGAAPGIAEFILNVPYSSLLGAAEAGKQGKSELAGALIEGGKRGVLGAIFKSMEGLKTYIKAPAMGTVFGTQAATDGADSREIAKSFGTGLFYGVTGPGGKEGFAEIKRDLEMAYVKEKVARRTFEIDERPKFEEEGSQKEKPPAPEGEGAAAGMSPQPDFRRPPEPTTPEPQDAITKRSDLVSFLEEKLDIPIRTGRFRQKALGIFKVRDEVIRSKNANDIEVISHEVGHGLHKFLWPETVTAKGLSARPFSAFENELLPMATRPGAGQEVLPEGFAEFVRLYITNEAQAKAKAPGFFSFFEGVLDQKSPESKEILLHARKQYEKWLKQPSLQRVLSQISIGKKAITDFSWQRLYTAAVDDLYPLKAIVNEMAKGGKVETAKDPYQLARLLRGWTGKTESFLSHSPFKFGTYENVGKPLRDILLPFRDRLDEFRAYIVSKRTLELEGRKIETGVLPEDARKLVSEYGADFEQAFKDLKEFQNHTLQYLKDSGILSGKNYAKIKALNDDYVPLYRVMEDRPSGGLGVGMEARDPIKKIKGSWRDIVDPLESVLKNTYLYIGLAEKNAVGQALVKLAQSKQGMGKFVEKIPDPMQKLRVTGEEIGKHLQKLGDRVGLEFPEELGDLLGDMDVFRKSPFKPADNVIAVWNKGKRELYEVHPDIASTFKALDRESVGTLMKLLSYPASWLRAGATLTPEFMVGNLSRDQFSALIYTKFGIVPGFDFIRGIFHVAKRDDLYWAWKKGGGDYSMMVSMDRDYLQENMGSLLQKYPVKNLITNPLNGLRALSEGIEEATRLGEFVRAVGKEGMTKEGIQKGAMASREVTLDFARHGAKMKSFNAITAFANAQLQGLDKAAREFKDNPAGVSIRAIASLTLPSVLLAIATHDDERVKEIPQWQRDLHWCIPIGDTVYRVKKPFEIGIVFGSIPERITHWIMDQDPHAFDGLLKTIGRGITPSVVPTAAIPIMENWANKSSFFDRPIVPRNREDLLPEYQYGPYTTETGKLIGKIIGKLPWLDQTKAASPAMVENMIYGWSGGLGRYALQTMDFALEQSGIMRPGFEKPAKTLADIPFVKAFVVRHPSANAESVVRFYESYQTAEQTVRTIKTLLQKDFNMDEALKLMEKSDNLVSIKPTYEALRNIHDMIDKITIHPGMSGDEKREMIDVLYYQMIEIAKSGNAAFDKIKGGLQ